MEEKLDFLAGQHHALLAAVYALIASHREPEEFRNLLRRMMDVALAKTLPVAVSEQYIQGFQEEQKELTGLAETACRITRLT